MAAPSPGSDVSMSAAPAVAPPAVVAPPKPIHSVLKHGGASKPRPEGVRFGEVEIYEHERLYMDSPVSGAPRLLQGPVVAHTLRRMVRAPPLLPSLSLCD